MVDEVNKLPDGVLAERALKEQKAEPPLANIAETGLMATPTPALLPVDPNYREPVPFEKYMETAAQISRETDPIKQNAERGALIAFLTSRVKALEEAMRPFATSAMLMSNARMCLIANHRPTDPAGGIWYSNPPDSVQLQPNEGYFYNAIDVYGRQRTHDFMVTTLERLHKMQEAQAEKDAHVENDGTVH